MSDAFPASEWAELATEGSGNVPIEWIRSPRNSTSRAWVRLECRHGHRNDTIVTDLTIMRHMKLWISRYAIR